MKQLMAVQVRGKSSTYSFHFKGDPTHLDDWRADGLSIYVIESSIPGWVVSAGLARPWGTVQRFWQILRLW